MTTENLSAQAREAVAAEQRIREEAGNTQTKLSEKFAERTRLEAELKGLAREHRDDVSAAARSGEKIDTAAHADRREQLTRALDKVNHEIEPLKHARMKLRTELTHHRGDNFGALAEVPEALTADAVAKEDAARRAYEEYVLAYETAQRTWNELVTDRNATRNDSGSRIGPVNNRDLPPASKLFPGNPPRPPQLEPVADGEELDEALVGG